MTKPSKRSGLPVALAMAALGTLGVLIGHGCGSVTNDRDDALNRATTATCNRYQECGLIGLGAGASFQTVDVCQAKWRDTFSTQWTPAECQGHIDQPMLDVCLSAISGTSCKNVLDVLTTLYVKCGAGPVCDVLVDAGSHD